MPPEPTVAHSTPTMTGEMQREAGAVFDAVTLKGAGDRIGAVSVSWRVYHDDPQDDMFAAPNGLLRAHKIGLVVAAISVAAVTSMVAAAISVAAVISMVVAVALMAAAAISIGVIFPAIGATGDSAGSRAIT